MTLDKYILISFYGLIVVLVLKLKNFY